MTVNYKPTPTLEKFHRSLAEARFIIGPYGSGKTHAMIMETLRLCAQQDPDPDGYRRTRVAIIRNTLQSLKQSVLPDILTLLKDLNVHYKVSASEIQIRFGYLHSDWLLLPMEEPKDERRLLSLQLSFAWLAEFRELDYEVVAAVTGRIGRYPPPSLVRCTRPCVYGESNPFSEDSLWYENLVLKHHANWDFFRQPGGLEPTAENVENLPPRYYERMMVGKKQDWIDVHVNAQFGESVAGQAVFQRSFTRRKHATPPGSPFLKPNPMRPLIIGFDFERHPAVVIGQIAPNGHRFIFAEAYADNMGPLQFASTHLVALLAEERFSGMRQFIVGDPSGATRMEIPSADEISDVNVFEALGNLGFAAYPATTNYIEPRLQAVEQLLLMNSITIDTTGCPTLVRALMHEYRYKKKKVDGELADKPDKNHPWSDLADALQYLALGAGADYEGWYLHHSNVERKYAKVGFGDAPVAKAAWT